MANDSAPSPQSTTEKAPAVQVKRSSASSSGPAVFGDGSTQAQQDQLVKEAEQANRETKKYADGQRDVSGR